MEKKSCRRGARTCGYYNCHKKATKQIIYPNGNVKAQYCDEHFREDLVLKGNKIKKIKMPDILDKIFVDKIL